ncbi:hypothetical protein QQA45_04510 [Sneathia sanguinegens]|uniref:beta-lactamase n=1 Tax=Sneathia sanguinegens TaxID=40543 RepID=A0ABT7HJS4_9FUSO|nr:hypothetical protein [Sneathia sanguinegens]MDK9580777.1 hypothetical protein [Sneathia sanguinegens]
MANKNKKINIKAIHFYFLFIVVFFMLICLRLIYYQVICSGEARKNIEKYRYELEDIYAKRGSIYSSDGHKLAFDVEKYNIILDPMNLDEKILSRYSQYFIKICWKIKRRNFNLITNI